MIEVVQHPVCTDITKLIAIRASFACQHEEERGWNNGLRISTGSAVAGISVSQIPPMVHGRLRIMWPHHLQPCCIISISTLTRHRNPLLYHSFLIWLGLATTPVNQLIRAITNSCLAQFTLGFQRHLLWYQLSGSMARWAHKYVLSLLHSKKCHPTPSSIEYHP